MTNTLDDSMIDSSGHTVYDITPDPPHIPSMNHPMNQTSISTKSTTNTMGSEVVPDIVCKYISYHRISDYPSTTQYY